MTRQIHDIHWTRVGSVGWLLAVLITAAIGTIPASAAVNPYRLRDFDHSGTACASISTTSGDAGFYKTAAPNNITGVTFDGTDLLFSCWTDNTITAIRPVASQTIFAKDTAVGSNGIYRVTGLNGIGGLAWDPTHNVLWACNLSAFVGGDKNKGSDLGYIRLNANGTATFTHFATAPDGCVNSVDYNPTTSVVSSSGVTNQDSTKTFDRYVVKPDLTAGTLTKFMPGTLTHDGYVSGVQSTTNGMYLADQHGPTKTLHYTTDFVSSTLVSSTTTRRYEDLACDPVTFAPKTVIWVEWFDHNQLLPFETTDTCIGISAPPPTLQISQDAPSPVVADSNMSFTVHVTNPGAAGQTGVTVTDTPPANTIFQSAQPSQGSCSGTTAITCSLGSLAGGATATLTVTVTPIQPGTISNAASAVSNEASQVSSNRSGTVNAESGVSYVSVGDSGYSPSSLTVPMGSVVQYNIFGSAAHDISENQTHLFDTGVKSPTSFARQQFNAAGLYTIVDSPSGKTQTVRIAPSGPAAATSGAPFTITWSANPLPSGYREDVQVLLPGSSTWTDWMLLQAGTSGSYTASTSGQYQFRARLRLPGTGSVAYGPAWSVSVS
jgi:uncharacterized repeat protein (TIGR01451 family)